jgi:hypothetical protein
VLTEFGVKRYLDLDELIAKCVNFYGLDFTVSDHFRAKQSDTGSAVEMVNHLSRDPRTENKFDEIRKHAIFPGGEGGKYCITELYFPHADIPPLGLPILDWPREIVTGSRQGTYFPDRSLSPAADSVPELWLTRLGLLSHPPLKKIIEIAGSPDPKIRLTAFKYLSDKFDEFYHKHYKPTDYKGMPFIPAIKDGKDCIGTYEEVRSH